MKEKDARIEFDLHPLILYVERDDGSYGRVESASYLSSNFLDDYYDKLKKWDADLRQKLEKGEVSPVYYFMIMLQFGEGDLASRAEVSKRKLRSHCQMKGFEKLSLNQLKKYADVFDVPVSNLLHFLSIKAGDENKLKVSYLQTDNPYFTISKIEIK